MFGLQLCRESNVVDELAVALDIRVGTGAFSEMSDRVFVSGGSGLVQSVADHGAAARFAATRRVAAAAKAGFSCPSASN